MRKNGFTLIELMVAVAIVGILTSLAVPAYFDYTIRAKVSEALQLASSAKISVSEFYISNARFPDDVDEAGIGTVETRYVSGIEYEQVGDGGTITMVLTAEVSTESEGKKISLTATPTNNNTSLRWDCASATANGLEKKYLPSSCR